MHQHPGTLSPVPPLDRPQPLALPKGFPSLRVEQTIAPEPLRRSRSNAGSARFKGCIPIRVLGRMEVGPSGEGQHSEIVSPPYLAGKPATEADSTRIAVPYGEWQGDWAHCLRPAW